MMRQAIRQQTSRSIGWALIESVGAALLGATSLFLLARLLSPEDFGTVSLVLALITFAEFWVTAPFSESLIQRRALQARHLDTAFWAMMAMAATACLACVLLSGPIATLFSNPLLRDLTCVYSFSLILAGLNGLPAIMLQRELSFRELSKRTLAGRTVSVASAVALAVLDFGVWSIVIGDLLGKVVATVMLWKGYRYRPALRFSFAHLIELLRFGWITSVEWLLWNLAGRAFIAGLGYFHGVTALGYLNLAMRLTDTINQVLNTVAQRFFLPVFSALQHNRADLRSVLARAAGAIFAVSAPTFLGIAALAPMAIELILGPRWLPAVPLIWVLCIFWVVSGSISAIGPYLKAIGKPLPLLVPALVASVLSLAVALSAGKLTLLGALACFSARILVNAPLLLYVAHQVGGVSMRKYFASIRMPLLAAVVMAVNVWTVGLALPAAHSWPHFIACIAFGVALYGTLLCVLDQRTAKWLWEFFREAAQRRSSPKVASAGAVP